MAVADGGVAGGLPPIRRREGLPNGRALVGGLLVAAAIVGLFGVQHAATAPPRTRYAVAARALVAGQALEPEDLKLAPAQLADRGRASAFTAVEPLLGRLLITNIGEGELVQRSSIGAVRGLGGGEREVSFSADPARSLGDRIGPGDVVDVLATYSDGGVSRTEPVVLFTRIVDRQERGGVGGAPGFIFTVAISRPEDVLRLASAIATSTLTVVRSTIAAATRNTTPYPGAVTTRGKEAGVGGDR